ncbi:MAG: sulfotransferase [Paracoccaceae bacterium]|nr:sulfotransferase [Paracoccaceae bacterium]
MKAPPRSNIAAAPGDPAALLKAAHRQLSAGETAAARATLDTLIARWPRLADAQAGRGFVARAEGDHGTALAAFEAALKLKPGEPSLLAARAETLATLGQARQAAEAWDALTARAPGALKPRLEKALALQAAGDFEAAGAAFRQALDLAPGNGEVYRLIAQSKRLTPEDPLIADMERLWARPDLPEPSRAHLGFALAKAMEDTGQSSRVFAYLRPANEAMRRAQPYDVAERERQVEALIRCFEGMDFASLPSAPPEPFGPVFVTGMPRSGTTLVEQILSAHSAVTGGGELAIFLREAERLLARPDGSLRQAATLTPGELAGLGRRYEDLARRAVQFEGRLTDKSIQTHLALGLVRAALPSARIVLVERDPRDVLFSIYKNVFMAGKHRYAYDLRDLARYWRAYRRIADFWRAAMPGGFHELRYEALVADPAPAARALLSAVDLPWEDGCLDFTGNRRAVKTLSAVQVRQSLYSSSVGAWRPYAAELAEMIDELGEID